MYANVLKRVFDFFLAFLALTVLSPLFLVLILLGAVKMKGNPFFTQKRPGKGERIFKLVKFRTMTNEKDKNGVLLPDDKRLTRYGRVLRATSLDELPELLNIIAGQMAVVGPRPLLVRDMVFMTDEQRKRHTVRQGLTGLAQVIGRNAISWESKLALDNEYIKHITLFGDIKIILQTVLKVLKHDGINEDGMATAEDLGDFLLRTGAVSAEEYAEKQNQAKKLMNNQEKNR